MSSGTARTRGEPSDGWYDMMKNAAEKRLAREYARRYGVSYRRALSAVREVDAPNRESAGFVTRLLIEAIEGCGIRHWARVVAWDGTSAAVIADVGGETFVLDADTLGPALREFVLRESPSNPLDIDSFHADDIVQSALFGGRIYRSEVRRRPRVAV